MSEPRSFSGSAWGEILYADLGSISGKTSVCFGPGIPATVPLTETIFRIGLNHKL